MIETISWVISCFFLVCGLMRLIRTVQFYNETLVNLTMIVWHIIAYFLIVIVEMAVFFYFSTAK